MKDRTPTRMAIGNRTLANRARALAASALTRVLAVPLAVTACTSSIPPSPNEVPATDEAATSDETTSDETTSDEAAGSDSVVAGEAPTATVASDPTEAQSDAAEPEGVGNECDAATPCPDGLLCVGEAGCTEGRASKPWTCQQAQVCTRDLRPYCGCDGKTFKASGSCPGRPHARPGAC